MSKKGYEDFAVIEYRIEKIVDKKIQLKNELNNEHSSIKQSLMKKIIKKRKEENMLWLKLHADRRMGQRKGTWNENFERVINNMN